MADPTAYDLVQDEILSRHDAALTGTPLDLSGDEVSYPVEGKAMGVNEWAWVTRGVGSGVLDNGGGSYRIMSISDVDDTITIGVSLTAGTANAIVNGFFHQLNKPLTLSIPPVSSTTTYYVCLTYNPVGLDQQSGPVTVQVYAGTPPTTSGKIHVTLATIVRKPSTVLSASVITKIRPRIAPTILVWDESELPEVTGVLWGTLCFAHRTNAIFVATGNTEDGSPTLWKRITEADTGWVNISDGETYKSASHGYNRAYRKKGDRIELRGRIVRTTGTNFGSNAIYQVMTLPTGYRPARSVRFATSGPGLDANSRSVVIEITAEGAVKASPEVSSEWVALDGIFFDIA